MSTRSRIAVLDAMRALAVFLVLASHFGVPLINDLYKFQNEVWNIGVTGVFLFFCISGYVIPLTLQNIRTEDGRLSAFAQFWVRRSFRLLPVYLILLIPAWFALSKTNPSSLDALRFYLVNEPILYILSTVTFTGYFFNHPLAFGGLEWSLAYEVVFYIACSLFILLGQPSDKRILIVIVLTMIMIMCLPWINHNLQKHMLMFFFFLLGFLTFLFQRGKISILNYIALSAISIFCVYWRVITWSNYWGISYLTLAAVLAPPLFLFGIFYRPNFRFSAYLAPIGLISYSIYLSHMLVVQLLPLSTWPGTVRFVVWMVADLSLSWCLYKYVESPANGLGHRLALRIPPTTIKQPSSIM